MAEKNQDVLTAEIIEETIHDTHGKEHGLGVASRLYLVLGVVAAVGGVLASALTANLAWIPAGMLALFVGITFHLVFGAQAEIIRLLKAQSGELYSGTISGNEKSRVFICSECGSSNYADVPVCRKCKAVFVKKPDNPEPSETRGS
jgi:hypothetical protein